MTDKRNLSRVWEIWDRDSDAVAARRACDGKIVLAAKRAAVLRDVDVLRGLEKRYTSAIKACEASKDRDREAVVKSLRYRCREVLRGDTVRWLYDLAGFFDGGDRHARPFYEYEAPQMYDGPGVGYGHRRVDVSDELRDRLYPPLMSYPLVREVLPEPDLPDASL